MSNYRHKGNGKLYRVLEKILLKDPDGNWVKGVSYQRAIDAFDGQKIYVRSNENFADRFVKILETH